MTEEAKKELVEEAASKVHTAWCKGELKGFHKRFLEAVENERKEYEAKIRSEAENEFMLTIHGDMMGSGKALQTACFKGDKRRNVARLSEDAYGQNWIWAKMQTFEGFLELIGGGYITVQRFTARNLTEEEIKVAGENYNPKTKEENILRGFKYLSADSKRENIQAAIGAVKVYEEYLKRGYTIEQLRSPEMREEIGKLIHADWMSRNKINSSNAHLFVSFDELDDWTKQQDLDVFYALLDIAEKNPEKYAVDRVEGLKPIDANAYEDSVMYVTNNDEYWLRNIELFK